MSRRLKESDRIRLNSVEKARPLRPRIQKMIDEGRVQEVIDNMTLRQRRFVEEYMIDFNATQAALRAGYTGKQIGQIAHRVLKNPAVKAALDAKLVQNGKDSTIHPAYVINKITKTIEKAERQGNHNAVLRGCELLARHLGMFIERQEISGPNGEAIKLEHVKRAADAFTESIASLVERSREKPVSLVAG